MGRVLGLLLLLATGCSTTWHHDSKTVQSFHKDRADCLAKAGQAAGSFDPYALVFRSTFESCMYGEGWTKQ